MPPALALFLWFILVIALLYFDPAKERKTSMALWAPLIWMFLAATRLPSTWFGSQVGDAAQALEEGNPLDRSVFLGLILWAVALLILRSFNWGAFFRRNPFLTAFLLFTLVSAFWSDFSFVSLKRWFRDLGNYVVILVALSDPRPIQAISTLLRRISYLLIPLSIVLDKYYPAIARGYDPWTGVQMYVGPTTGKNLLGVVGLVSGLFFFWDTVTRWPNRKIPRIRRIILVNCAFIPMSILVLRDANSTTSRVCFVLGCIVIAALRGKMARRYSSVIKAVIPAGFCLYLLLGFGLGMNGQMAGAIGKDPTLTDRTEIWAFVLGMHTNPLVGTGYESFWMGRRLQYFWQNAGQGRLNEAHNGYLEVYLNLGIIGVSLAVGLLISGYRTTWKNLDSPGSLGSLPLALWLVFLFYNVTEAGFRGGLLWVVFLIGTLALPKPAKSRILSSAESAVADGKMAPRDASLETAGGW